MNDEIAAAKKAFLAKYNRSRTDEEATSRAIRAAVGRNALYDEPADTPERRKRRARFLERWHAALRDLSRRSAITDNSDAACELIVELRDRMRREADDVPINVNFRISHAQKSLSVYCKHLWCMGWPGRPRRPDEQSDPAICPVDYQILAKVGARAPLNAWGWVDDIATYKEQLRLLQVAADAKGRPLAGWELLTFPINQP